MKKTLTIIAFAVASFSAMAQDSNSASTSGSNSGSTSNSTATGNVNASQSQSGSQSGASSGSLSGAVGNTVIFNPSSAGATSLGAGGIPTTRVINQTDGTSRLDTNLSGTTTANQNQTLSGGTNSTNTNTDNVRYSGQIDNHTSGGTTNTSFENVNYSGTQTIKNVPAIAMSGPASGPCTGASGGLGLAGPGWGVGLNGSSVMADCRLRENTRVLGMGMQSIDGGANPQEKGETMVMFMDAMRGLAAYNNKLIAAETGEKK